MSKQGMIEVKATVNLPGLQAGRAAMVNPDLPWIKQALANKTLVRTDEGETPEEEATAASGS